MRLTHRSLKTAALAYLGLPVLIFVCGFLRWQLALPACAALLFGFYRAHRDNFESRFEKTLTVGGYQLAALIGVILLWTYLGGLNGLFFQSDDWPWRNAIYHDLIDNDWPVVYPEKGSALVYYIGFWLPPALAAKIVGWVSGSAVWAWRAARGALWLWSSLGLTLISLLLMLFAGADTKKKQWTVVLVFIFFSGMDLLGALYADTFERVTDPTVLHLEWWTKDGKQFSSITTCVYWVFNQTIIPWLATICFLMEKDARNYLFLGIACLCSGPLPFVGLVICMAARWISSLVQNLRTGRGTDSVRTALSVPNVALLVLIFPLIGAYFLGNLSVANTGSQTAQLSLLESLDAYLSWDHLVFLALDAGIFMALLMKKQFRNPLFYAVGLSLLVIPYFHIGSSEDFCLRASVPGIFLVMTWCAEYLVQELPRFRSSSLCSKAISVLLIAALLIGAATPVMEIWRGVYNVLQEGTVLLAKDGFGTIAVLDEAANFTAANYSDTFFFKYLAR